MIRSNNIYLTLNLHIKHIYLVFNDLQYYVNVKFNILDVKNAPFGAF